MFKLLALLAVFCVPVSALAANAESVPGLIGIIKDGFGTGQWALVVGAAIMILVRLARPFVEKLVDNEKLKPALKWIAAILGVLAAFAGMLLAGQGWIAAVVTGLVTGPAAVGLWELVGKSISKLISKKK